MGRKDNKSGMTKTDKSKTRRRKEARPAEIVEAGISEFATYGFDGARLERIAKIAGISKATIYLYYPSKEALFLAAVEEHVISVMADNESFLDSFDGTTAEMLARLLRGIYGRFTNGRAQTLFRILITEGDRIPEIVTDYHTMTIKRGTALLRRILERGIMRGEVADGPILQNPQVVIAPAMFFALHNMMFHRAGTLDFEAYFEAHLELVIRGVEKQADPKTRTN